MDYANPDALVATGWLADRLGDPGIRIVDASWYLPGVDRSGRAEHAERHIPGAVYWDLDEIADPADPLPHMLPDAATFAEHMARLGIGDGMRVVAYDAVGSMTAGVPHARPSPFGWRSPPRVSIGRRTNPRGVRDAE